MIIGLYKVGKQAYEEQEKQFITKVDFNQILFNVYDHLRKGNIEKAKNIIRKNVFINEVKTDKIEQEETSKKTN